MSHVNHRANFNLIHRHLSTYGTCHITELAEHVNAHVHMHHCRFELQTTLNMMKREGYPIQQDEHGFVWLEAVTA